MNYLIVNHIKALRGRDAAHLRLPKAWLDELRASSSAMAPEGVKLIVATPVIDPRDEDDESLVEISPDDAGFEHLPVAGYGNVREYLACRAALAEQLRGAVEAADVVQLDDGGHPVPVGLDAYDAATLARRKRVWVFGNDDPADRLRLINLARRAAKRLVGHTVNWNMTSRLADAVRGVDLVLAHSPRVVKRYSTTWDRRCHLIDRVEVHDHELLDGPAIEERRTQLAESTRPLRLLAAGRQIALSGTDHVLRAVAKCRRLHVPVELVVAGDGQDLDYFRSLAWQLGLEGGVRFIVDREEVSRARRECDVLVSGILSDAVPREAMLGIARGLVPIMYAAPDADPTSGPAPTDGASRFGEAIVTVSRGDVDRLADRIVHASGHRAALVQRMFKGLAWVKPRTVEATHRTRVALVKSLIN